VSELDGAQVLSRATTASAAVGGGQKSHKLRNGLRIVTETDVTEGIMSPAPGQSRSVFATKHVSVSPVRGGNTVPTSGTGLSEYADMLLKEPEQRLPGETRVLVGFVEDVRDTWGRRRCVQIVYPAVILKCCVCLWCRLNRWVLCHVSIRRLGVFH